MSEDLAKYEYQVGLPKKYVTEYEWTLNNWSQLYDYVGDFFVEGFTSPYFVLNGAISCTCKVFLSPRTPEEVLSIQLSETLAIETLTLNIYAGGRFWKNQCHKPIQAKLVHRVASKSEDDPKGIFKTDKNDALVIRVRITIMKVSDCQGLLNPGLRLPQILSISNPPQNNILANFKMMFDRKAFCDITFVLGDKTFCAHKAVLAAQSTVFKTMFSSDMKEQNANTIEISNFDAEVFEQFLNYLYSGEGLDLDDKVEELIVVADFYNVADLKIKCENVMLRTLSEKSAVRYVMLADKINCDKLKTAALHLIRKSSTIIEKAFLDGEDAATTSDLKEILSKNQLTV